MKNITIIGAGAVGRSLAFALYKGGMKISGIYSAEGRSAAAVARKCKAKYSGVLNEHAELADMVIIAVPDGHIPDVVRSIAEMKVPLRGKIIVHTSGALTSDELHLLKKKGAAVGSFHPLQTFPKRQTVTTLKDCWFAVEGDKSAVAAGVMLAQKCGARHFSVSKKNKTLYHIAAVFASNYQVTLFSVVEQLAAEIKIPRQDLWNIFRPLITRTMENVFESSPADALTGPIARGDYNTIMKHIAVLESSKSLEHLIPLYSALGVETAKLAKHKR